MRGRKLRPRDERRPQIPPCPAHVTDEARAEWQRITKLLKSLGRVAKLDRAALAIYCTAWARLVQAEQKVGEMGTVVKSPNGYPIQNPYLSIANTAAKQIAGMLSEFGLSPAARARLLKREDERAEIELDADEPPPIPPGRHFVGKMIGRHAGADEFAFTCAACGFAEPVLRVPFGDQATQCPACGNVVMLGRENGNGQLALVMEGPGADGPQLSIADVG